MARARTIKPGFFSNEILAECSPLARILFVGLWCFADREGRLEDRPKRLKVAIVPFDNCDVSALLDELETSQFIQRYESDAGPAIQVLNFLKHQSPHMKELASTISAPPQSKPRRGLASTQHQPSTNLASTQHQPSTNLAPNEPRLNPSPVSLNPSPVSRDSSLRSLNARDEEFNFFWEAYPHKIGKAAARKAFDKAIGKTEDVAALVAGVRRYIETKPADREWCNPSTWLNQERWLDMPAAKTERNSHGPATELADAGQIAVAVRAERRRRNADRGGEERGNNPAPEPLLDGQRGQTLAGDASGRLADGLGSVAAGNPGNGADRVASIALAEADASGHSGVVRGATAAAESEALCAGLADGSAEKRLAADANGREFDTPELERYSRAVSDESGAPAWGGEGERNPETSEARRITEPETMPDIPAFLRRQANR